MGIKLAGGSRRGLGRQVRIQDFGQGGPSRVLTPRGDLSPKFAQNRGFPLKIA